LNILWHITLKFTGYTTANQPQFILKSPHENQNSSSDVTQNRTAYDTITRRIRKNKNK